MGKKQTEKPIARLPRDNTNDEHCRICGDNTVVLVIQGGANCHYCGNQINLCSVCCAKMKYQINGINDGSIIKNDEDK